MVVERIDLRLGLSGDLVTHDGERFALRLDDGSEVSAGELLVATGRRVDLAAVGVGAVGLDEGAHRLAVDENLRAFTDPEVGAVGRTEAQARADGLDVRAAVVRVPPTARGWIHKAGNEGVIKLVADGDRGVLVGATVAGPNGGEVLGLLTLAVHVGVPLADLRSMIWAYPTFHRGVEDAVHQLTG